MPARTVFNQDAGYGYLTTITCSEPECDRVATIVHDRYSEVPFSETANETFRFHRGNSRYLSRCRPCEREHVARWRANRAVPAAAVEFVPSLGLGRQFGVEIELIFPHETLIGTIREQLADANLSEWRVKSDGSLSGQGNGHGLEIVSPPLSGDEGLQEIRTACRILSQLGGKPNRTCGLHVHHDVGDLDLEDFKRVVIGWSNSQAAIDGLVSPTRRRGTNQYCKRLSGSDRSKIMQCEDLRRMGHLRISRYKTLNVAAYPRYGTVEIRQHQGTVDAEKIIAWVRFGQALVDCSRQASLPVSRTVDQLLERLGEYLDSAAKTFLATRAARFAADLAAAPAVAADVSW